MIGDVARRRIVALRRVRDGNGRRLVPCLLVHPDVVDDVLLRQVRGDAARLRASRVVAADGSVQDDEEVLVEWGEGVARRPVGVPLRAVLRGEVHAVHVPAHLIGLPLDGIDVEVVCEVDPAGRVGAARTDVVGPAPAEVDRPADPVSAVGGLHDVDLAARGPSPVGIVLRHHPERRPHSAAGRDLGPHLDPAVEEGLLVPRKDLARGELPSAVVLLARGEDQVAAGDGDVLWPVVLEFVVAPSAQARAAVADVDRPVAGVEARAVELVRPHEGQGGERGSRGNRQKRDRQHQAS